MKLLRKWSRILHRDIGYFFIGASIIYGLSGIALNHLHDWNPNYVVKLNDFTTDIPLERTVNVKDNILKLLDEIDDSRNYKSHYFPEPGLLKIFLKGGSSVLVNTDNGRGRAEYLKKRKVFYEVNFLHYNPNSWWMWFSDIFAGALILLAITSIFMVRGKKGAWGRGGIYIVAGIIIPILFLIFL
ncbi:MAG: PepSY-associated TM helix domain-containing protein [Bacteroidales bacterium]|nr:PepSY-associated TM helix domain-containing protein [Bacteroidales bacterium]MCF8403592.1 PepSY-associated TM helix domain-containing protein [Bacteroidales bacterium]